MISLNLDTIKTIFKMFSGVEDPDEYQDLIQSAMNDMASMLSDPLYYTDSRLSFVCASLANWKYQQFMASRDRLNYTYAGTVSQRHDGKDQLQDAENMFYHYLATVKDIITDGGFYFKNV